MMKRSLIIAALALAGTHAGAAPQQQAHPVRRAPASASSEVEVSRIKLRTGVELTVAQAGPRDGMPVLFLHGYTDSWHSYELVLDRLPPGVRAIVPTQRGHGDSEQPACCYGIPELAADGVALLDALGVDRAVVVGHSMGSFVAQRIAAEHPKRVTKLVLIGSGNTLKTPVVAELNDAIQTLTDPVMPPDFVRDFQTSMVRQMPPASFMALVIEESGRMPARVWRAMLAALLRSDADTPGERITAPVLVVWGDRDEVFPRSSQDSLLASLREGRLIVYEDTGHSPHWEYPARFVEELAAFIDDKPYAAKPDAGTTARQ